MKEIIKIVEKLTLAELVSATIFIVGLFYALAELLVNIDSRYAKLEQTQKEFATQLEQIHSHQKILEEQQKTLSDQQKDVAVHNALLQTMQNQTTLVVQSFPLKKQRKIINKSNNITQILDPNKEIK